MKVYLIKNTVTNQYYLKKGRWHTKIFCESYFTERAAKWHRTYWLNNYPTANDADILAPSIVIEEYEMINLSEWLWLKNGKIGILNEQVG